MARTWVLDLDGVVWVGDQVVPGAASAVDRLRRRGIRPVFVTNNSAPTVGELVAKLGAAGIAGAPDDVVTSAQAAATLVPRGSRVLVVAGPGAAEALVARGVQIVTEPPVDVVLVGLDRSVDYDALTAATRAVLAGARLLGTNDDPTYPSPDGPAPGAGALLAAVATATGVTPEVAGKPHDAMVRLLAARAVGGVELVVGDRPSTDGLLARRLGAPFALVLTGVTGTDDVVPPPDVVAATLADVVDRTSR